MNENDIASTIAAHLPRGRWTDKPPTLIIAISGMRLPTRLAGHGST